MDGMTKREKAEAVFYPPKVSSSVEYDAFHDVYVWLIRVDHNSTAFFAEVPMDGETRHVNSSDLAGALRAIADKILEGEKS